MAPKHVEHWDDETGLGHGVIITLHYGWSFEPNEHQGVRSFETITEARDAVKIKNLYRCHCEQCRTRKVQVKTKLSSAAKAIEGKLEY